MAESGMGTERLPELMKENNLIQEIAKEPRESLAREQSICPAFPLISIDFPPLQQIPETTNL
jgi:hypothetical protein